MLALKLETREAEVGLANPGGSPLGVFDRISRMVLRISPDAVADDPDAEDDNLGGALIGAGGQMWVSSSLRALEPGIDRRLAPHNFPMPMLAEN